MGRKQSRQLPFAHRVDTSRERPSPKGGRSRFRRSSWAGRDPSSSTALLPALTCRVVAASHRCQWSRNRCSGGIQ